MERKKFFAQHTPASRPETFAMQVDGYDTRGGRTTDHFVYGTRLDNGEPVEVSLRQVEYTRKGNMKRSEIADFAAPRKDRQHPGTAVGGILLAQEAFKQADGSFAARWIQSLSHSPGEAEVFEATVHVSHVKRAAKTAQFPDGRPYSTMTVLHDGDFRSLSEEMLDLLKIIPPFKVESTQELSEAISDLLADNLGVGVRVSTAEGFDAMYVGGKHDDTIPNRVGAFMKDVEPMAAGIDSGEVVCEVVPFSNVWAGPATVDIMLSNKVMASRVKQFNTEMTGDNGRLMPVGVYRPAIVAVRLSKANDAGSKAVFFSHVEPLWTREPVNGLMNALCYASTEHLAPEPPRPAPSKAANGLEAPPAARDPEDGSFTAGGPLDEGLMDAAEGVAPANADIGEDVPPVDQPAPQPEARRSTRSYANRARA